MSGSILCRHASRSVFQMSTQGYCVHIHNNFQRLTHGLVRWLLLPIRLCKDARPLIRARGSLKYASNFWTIFPFPLSSRPQWGCSIMAELSWANFSRPCTVKSFLCLHIPPRLFIWFVGNKWPGLLKPPLYPSILPSSSLTAACQPLFPLPCCFFCIKGAHSLRIIKGIGF